MIATQVRRCNFFKNSLDERKAVTAAVLSKLEESKNVNDAILQSISDNADAIRELLLLMRTSNQKIISN